MGDSKRLKSYYKGKYYIIKILSVYIYSLNSLSVYGFCFNSIFLGIYLQKYFICMLRYV